MKKKLGIIAALAITSTLAFGGMSAFATETETSTDTKKEMKLPDENQKMVFGKVTAIDGDEITLVTAEMPEFNKDGEKPEAISDEDSKENPQTPPENAEEGDSNKNPQMKEIEFSGEEVTLTVSDESIIYIEQKKEFDKTAAAEKAEDISTEKTEDENNKGTRGMMAHEEVQGSLSDIEVGSIINLRYTIDDSDNETLTQIIVRNQIVSPEESE